MLPETPDAPQPEQFVTMTPPPGRRWVFVGGDEDADSVTLHLLVAGDGGVTRRYTLRIELDAGADGMLRLGAASLDEEGER
jgi:hypothetical protein